MRKMSEIFVFVYGTLKKGHGNHRRYLDGSVGFAQFIQDDKIEGILYDLGPFPAVQLYTEKDPVENRRICKGEVYKIDEEVLKKLDILEGYPSLYDRTLILTKGGIKAWVYNQKKEDIGSKKILESGIWPSD